MKKSRIATKGLDLEYSSKEVAKVFGCTQQAINHHERKAYKKLKELFNSNPELKNKLGV